jgi:NAD(P)-dependent dehydrogenase (short-subunit alcohol dehydrogenase family)
MAAGQDDPWSPRGTVLVTGGTGAAGAHMARWVARRGAPRVVLASRSGAAAAAAAGLAAELAEAGATVSVATCDVTDRAAVAALLSWIDGAGPALCGVLHTAAVLDDGVLDRLDPGRLGTVLGPKAAGAAVLDELTAGRDLDAFVLFSSAAVVFGSAGQGGYTAANAYLDALAEHRRGRGLAGLSVAWGQWGGGGLAESSPAVQARLKRGALPPMEPEQAIRALGPVTAPGYSTLAVMDIDWERFAAAPGAASAPLLQLIPEITRLAQAGPSAGAPPAPGSEASGLVGELAGLGWGERVRVVAGVVRGVVAGVLGFGVGEEVGGGGGGTGCSGRWGLIR